MYDPPIFMRSPRIRPSKLQRGSTSRSSSDPQLHSGTLCPSGNSLQQISAMQDCHFALFALSNSGHPLFRPLQSAISPLGGFGVQCLSPEVTVKVTARTHVPRKDVQRYKSDRAGVVSTDCGGGSGIYRTNNTPQHGIVCCDG